MRMAFTRTWPLTLLTLTFPLLASACLEVSSTRPPSPETLSRTANNNETDQRIESTLSALQNPRLTDGTLLIGLKEAGALSGREGDGRRISIQKRLAAEAAIRQAFPSLEIIDGVVRTYPAETSTRGVPLTIHRPFLRVRAPLNGNALLELTSHPNVQYIEPNYTNGHAAAAYVTRNRVGFAESRPWGLDSIRAPFAWGQGYTGGSVTIGLVDSGFDIQSPGFQVRIQICR